MATSFYNHDRNSDIAPELVKILLECNQEVPEFLENDKPVDGKLIFHDDTDDEDENGDANDGTPAVDDSWGAPSGGADDAWGAPAASAPAAGGDGWGEPAASAPIADAW